ncbi:MAG: methylmalonyl-CoA epimerase [candidate division Zixibacteria bacterium]|nr:methylmalonyl-CoA epimerase [candidate division Zixibacteria bacterium]
MSQRNFMSHIGIAVANLEEAINRYEMLTDNHNPHIAEVPDQKVKVAIFSTETENSSSDGGRIELVSPTSDDSPIAKFIQKKGEGLHHICIYVDDLDKKLAELKSAGARLIDESPRIGAEGTRIAFVHPSTTGGVLIELEERSSL